MNFSHALKSHLVAVYVCVICTVLKADRASVVRRELESCLTSADDDARIARYRYDVKIKHVVLHRALVFYHGLVLAERELEIICRWCVYKLAVEKYR